MVMDRYDIDLEEFLPSSNSEFTWNKRVQITNEVPVVDIYDGAHHLLRDGDMWEWFLGSSVIYFDIPYNISTNGEEIWMDDGNILESSIAKYVNGVRAQNYGPQPQIVNGNLEIPRFVRMEQYGIILPETDLYLHEIYRYLDRLYPDHPDYVQILTDNEINDNLNQAGAIVDFQLNTPLMEWLAYEMEYGELKGADLQRGKDYESIKMKIRNLWNHSFNRKLFGALQGYKWYGSDIWQHMTVYQVGEYLPIKPYELSDSDVTYQMVKIKDGTASIPLYFIENNKFIAYNQEQISNEFLVIINKNDNLGVLTKHILNSDFILGSKNISATMSINHLELLDPADMEHYVYNYVVEWATDVNPVIQVSYPAVTYDYEQNRKELLPIKDKSLIITDIPDEYNEQYIWVASKHNLLGFEHNIDPVIEFNNTNKYIRWYRDFQKEPNVDDRSINKWHPLLNHKFRMIDWDNRSYNYHVDPPAEVYGTAHSTPNSFYDIYEFRTDANPLIPTISIDTDFKPGWQVKVDGNDAYLHIIYPESSWDPYLTIVYNQNDDFTTFSRPFKELPKTVCHVLETYPSLPEWTPFNLYGFDDVLTIKDFIIDADKNHANEMSEYMDCFTGPNPSFMEATIELMKLYSSNPDLCKPINFVPSPQQKGELYLPVGKTFTFYPDFLNTTIVKNNQGDFRINYLKDKLNNDSVIKIGQLLSNNRIAENQNDLYIAEVSGFRKGYMVFDEIKMDRPLYDDEVRELVTNVQNDPIAKHCICYENYVNKNKFVLYGKPEFELSDYDANHARKITRIKFNITDFPRYKSYQLMRFFYGKEFETIIEKKFEQISIIFGYPIQTGNFAEQARYYIMYINDAWYIPAPTFGGVKQALDDIDEQCRNGYLTQTSNLWNKLATAMTIYCNTFDTYGFDLYEGHFKSLKSDDVYQMFLSVVNTSPIYDAASPVKYNYQLFHVEWKKFYDFLKSYIDEEIFIIKAKFMSELDRSYYSGLDPSTLGPVQGPALLGVIFCDTQLDKWLPNRAFIFEQMPSDIYCVETPPDNIYLGINEQMDGYKFLKLIPDPIFNCYINFTNDNTYGTGRIEDWDTGALQLCELVENNVDVLDNSLIKTDIDEHFKSTSTNKPYITQYEYDNQGTPVSTIYPYLDLNEDIKTVNNDMLSWERKFSFATYNFINKFNITYRNVVGSPVSPYEVRIRSIIDVDEDPYKITFVDEVSVERFGILSPGDYILGKTIENDTYIVSIDTKKNAVYVNHPLSVSGDFVLKYQIKLDIYPIELNDSNFYDYRKFLDKKEILDKANPFDHGFYGSEDWPYPSMTFVNSPIDIRDYYEILLDKIRESMLFKTGWNNQVLKLYIDEADKYSSYVLPAFVNTSGDLFVEVNAYRTYEDDKYLCKKEMLDHFYNSVKELSRASDNVNIGFNITAETDNSGRYIFRAGDKHTDEHIKNKFIALNWSENTIPYYYEIGDGYLSDVFKDKNDNENPQGYEPVPRSFWNYDVYAGSNADKNSRNLYRINAAVFSVVDSPDIISDQGTAYGYKYTRIDLPSDFIIPPDIKDFYVFFNDEQYSVSGSGDHYITTDLIAVPVTVGSQIVFQDVTGPQDILIAIENRVVIEPKQYLAKEGPAFYSMGLDAKIKIKEPSSYEHIDHPLYSGTLGEHEVHTYETFDDHEYNGGSIYSTVQFSTIKDLKSYNKKTKLIINFEQFYNDQLLINMIVDENNKNVEFNEVWLPAVTPKGSINWPDVLDLSQLYYKTINKSVKININGNISIFKRGSIIINELDKWGHYKFTFAGLLGSSSILGNMINDLPEDVQPAINYFSYPYILDKDIAYGQADLNLITIKYRLIIKLLCNLGILVGNLNNIYAFTESELTLLFDLIYNRVNSSTISSYNPAYTDINTYVIDVFSIENPQLIDIKKTVIPKDVHQNYCFNYSDLTGNILTEDQFSYETERNSIYLFEIAGISGSNKFIDLNYFDGEIFALYYDYNDKIFYAYSINKNKLFLETVDTSVYLPGLDGSFELDCWRGKFNSDASIFPKELYNSLRNNILLPDDPIEETFNSLIKLNFVIDAYGWTWDHYLEGDRLPVDLYDINEQSIHYDSKNKLFYTYNRKGRSDEKYVINIENNKYFKNCLYLIGSYKTNDIVINNNVEQYAKLSAIDGILFEMGDVSPQDRILEIEEIDIRSKYSVSLESYLFSSYATVRGKFKGIYVDETNNQLTEYLLMGYNDASGPEKILEKLKFKSEVSKIMPLKGTVEYTLSSCDFDEAYWMPENQRILWPEITQLNIYDVLSSESRYDFRFLKNTLILEGIIDTVQMNGIDFSSNPVIGDALEYLAPGDSIVGLVGLSSSRNLKLYQTIVETKTPDPNNPDPNFDNINNAPDDMDPDIAEVNYRNGYFITATDDGKVTVHKVNSVQYLGVEAPSYVYILTEIDKLKGGNKPWNTKLTGIAWDESTQHWILSYVSAIKQSFFFEFTAEDGTYKVIDDGPGVDVNTYQIIEIIDEDSRQNNDNYNYEQDKNQYIRVNARDIALVNADLVVEPRQEYFTSGDWQSVSGAGNFSDTQNPAGKTGILVNGPKDIITSVAKPIKVDPGLYTEVDFQAQQTSGNGSMSFYVNNAGNSFVDKVYYYDRDMMDWIDSGIDFNSSQNNEKTAKLISDFKIKNETRIQAFILASDFLYEKDSNGNIVYELDNNGNPDPTKPVLATKPQSSVPVPPPCPEWPVPKYNGEDLFKKESYVYGPQGNPLIYDYLMVPNPETNPGGVNNNDPNAAPHYIYQYDASGRKIFVNPKYTEDPVTGQITFNVNGRWVRELEIRNGQSVNQYNQPWDKFVNYRNYVRFGDYGQELDYSYPPNRNPYSGGSLPFIPTVNHTIGWAGDNGDNNGKYSSDQSAITWYQLFMELWYSKKPAILSKKIADGKVPKVYPDPKNFWYPPTSPNKMPGGFPNVNSPNSWQRYPYVTIADQSKYFVQTTDYPDQAYVPYIDKDRIKPAMIINDSNIFPGIKVDEEYYSIYGYHLEFDPDEANYKEIFIITDLGAESSGMHKANYDYLLGPPPLSPDAAEVVSTIQVERILIPALIWVPNSPLANQGHDYLKDLFNNKQIKSDYTTTLDINKDNPSRLVTGGSVSNFPDFIIDIPTQLGDRIKGNKGSSSGPTYIVTQAEWNRIKSIPAGVNLVDLDKYTVQLKNYKKNGDSHYIYNYSLEKKNFPFLEYCLVPDWILSDENLIYRDFLEHLDEQIFLSIEWIHPEWASPYGNPRFWPRFEVPIDYQDQYLLSDDWVREVYIYTDEYQEYVNKYNSFIQGVKFGNYIKNLRKYWNYYGSQQYNSVQNPNLSVLAKYAPTSDYDFWFLYNPNDLNGPSARYLLSPYSQALPYWELFGRMQQIETQVPIQLKKLPLPYLNNNVEVVAVQVKPGVNEVFVNGSFGPGQYKVIDFIAKPTLKIQSTTSVFDWYKEGTYNPFKQDYYVESLKQKLEGTKFVATNNNNIEVRIYGDKMFVYSPTKTWSITGYIDKSFYDPSGNFVEVSEPVYSFGKLSSKNHWKMAQLPNKRHCEVKSFQMMTYEEAYTYVKELHLTTKVSISNILTNLAASGSATNDVIIDNPTNIQQALQLYLNWLDNVENEPIKFDSEEMIPPYIELRNCVFTQTENGKIPVFSFDTSADYPKTKYYARESEIETTGDVEKRTLIIDNYIKYLSDYAIVVLGDTRWESFFDFDDHYEPQNPVMFGTNWAGFIKTIYLTDSVLGIITKYDDVLTLPVDFLYCRDDIENFNNWNISNIDSQYLLETQSNDNFAIKTFGFTQDNVSLQNDQIDLWTYNQFPIEHPTKGFTLSQKIIINNNIIFVGYVQANQMVENIVSRQTKYSIYNEIYPNDGWKYFGDYNPATGKVGKKYPVIFYSSNGGKSFRKANIPVRSFIPDIKAYTNQITTADGSIIEKNAISNIECYSVHRVGEDYRVWFKNPDKTLKEDADKNEDLYWPIFNPGKLPALWNTYDFIPLGYTSFTNKDGVLEYNEDIVDAIDDDEKELNISYNAHVIDNTTVNLTMSQGNKLLVQKPFTLDSFKDIKINGVLNNNITFDQQETQQYQEKLRVLVAIKTSKSILNQNNYLELKSEYIDSTGHFLVPEVIQVDNESTANRVYSFRESLKPSERKTNRIGIPSTKEDLDLYDRKYYLYEDPIDYKGVETYLYTEMRNQEDQPIFYCNDENDYLSELNSESPNNRFLLWNLIDNNSDVISLQTKAASIADGVELINDNIEFTSYLNDNLKKDAKVKMFSIENNDPKLLIKAPELDKIISGMADPSNCPGFSIDPDIWPYFTESKLYKWPVDSNGDPETQPEIYDRDSNGYEKYESPTEFGQAVLYIADYDNQYNIDLGESEQYRNYPAIIGRLSPYKIGNDYYVKDKVSSCVLLKTNNIVQTKLYVPYLYKQGYQQYINKTFNCTEHFNDLGINDFDYLESVDESYPITGVFINPLGYSGSMSTTSWDEIQPYEADYVAWEDEIVYNTDESKIYLTDTHSNVIYSKHGFFEWKTVDEPVIIHYDNLKDEKNIISIYESYPGQPSIYNVFKLADEPYSYYCPTLDIYLNAHCQVKGYFALQNDITMPSTTDYYEPYCIDDQVLITPSGDVQYNEGPSRNKVLFISKFYIMKFGLVRDESEFTYEFTDGNSNRRDEFILKDHNIYYCPEDNAAFTNDWLTTFPDIPGAELVLTVKDRIQTFSVTFNIMPNSVSALNKIVKINHLQFINKKFNSPRLYNIYFDGWSITKSRDSAPNFVPTNSVILNNNFSFNNALNKPIVQLKCLLNMYETFEYITDTKSNTKFYIFIGDIHAQLLLQREWAWDSASTGWETVNNRGTDGIYTEVYAGNIDISNMFNIEQKSGKIVATSKRSSAVVLSKNIQFYIPVLDVSDNLYNYIYTNYDIWSPDEKGFEFTYSSNLIIDGLYGKIMLKKPKYKNMYELIQVNNRVIKYRTPRIIDTYDGSDINKIDQLDKKYTFITLKELLSNSKYNDSSPHFISVKVMPVQSIVLPVFRMNNSDYINEVSVVEKDVFGFDRIWENVNGYPHSPITMGKNIYYKENMRYYYQNGYRNQDDFTVYSCDENGKYIKYTQSNSGLSYKVLGDTNGSLVGDIYGNVDSRYNPLQPLYDSSVQWLLKEFYLDGIDCNPFWQWISVKQKYNTYTKSFGLEYSVVEDKKVLGQLTKVLNDTSEYANIKTFEIDGQYIRFFLSQCNNIYNTSSYINRYGIQVNNFLNPGGDYRDIYIGKCVFENNDIDVNYVMNTNESFVNSTNKDVAVVGITEMGLFDKGHKLIAYMHHPIVEYRTDCQHISYTTLIKQGKIPILPAVNPVRP